MSTSESKITMEQLQRGYPELFDEIFKTGYDTEVKAIWTALEQAANKKISIQLPLYEIKLTAVPAIPINQKITAAEIQKVFPALYLDILAAGQAEAAKTTAKLSAMFTLHKEMEDRQYAAKAKVDAQISSHRAQPGIVLHKDLVPLTEDERLKKDWNESHTLRAEFRNNFLAYEAYMKASARGLVRIMGGGRLS